MYRVRGHLNAHLDPLHSEPPALHAELDIANYGLTMWDLQRSFVVDGLAGRSEATLEEILSILREAYCRTTGIEYGHIMDPEQKRWIQQRVEGVSSSLSVDEQHRVLEALNEAEVFERFLHSRYVGQKRFGLEGGESTIVALRTILDVAADEGTKKSSSHGAPRTLERARQRRRQVLQRHFSEFEGNLDPESVQGSGDVKYHKGARGEFKNPAAPRSTSRWPRTLRISKRSHPSSRASCAPSRT